jgi:thioredoxin-related protein
MMLCLLVFTSLGYGGIAGWTADLEQAKERAKKENKMVLIEFTGSDWCPPCMRMRQQVFSKKSFISHASKHFVLVELDFPMGNPALKKKNDRYAQQFRIEGMPMIVLLDENGNEFTRFFASDYPTEKEFMRQLERVLEKRRQG